MSHSPRVTDLIDELRSLIEEVAAQGIEKLPSERALADVLHVPRSTLRRALDQFESENRIVRVKGRAGGAFITAVVEAAPISPIVFDSNTRKVRRDLNSIKGIPQLLVEQGFRAETRVVSESLESAPPAIAEALSVEEGHPLVSLLRLRIADGSPLSLERAYLDPDRFPNLLDHSPIVSLYRLLESEYGTTIATSDETIEITAATRQVATLLALRPWTPVLTLRRVSHSADGTPIEASIDLFRADRTRLTVRTVVDA